MPIGISAIHVILTGCL